MGAYFNKVLRVAQDWQVRFDSQTR